MFQVSKTVRVLAVMGLLMGMGAAGNADLSNGKTNGAASGSQPMAFGFDGPMVLPPLNQLQPQLPPYYPMPPMPLPQNIPPIPAAPAAAVPAPAAPAQAAQPGLACGGFGNRVPQPWTPKRPVISVYPNMPAAPVI